MGLVQPRENMTLEGTQVQNIGGYEFIVDNSLLQLTDQYGSIVIDYRDDFYWDDFILYFERLAGC